jgi:DNA polymerase I-like protein with 3'-5' exonuclease and polymerase domains
MWNRRRARIVSDVPGAAPKHHIAFNRLVQGGCGQILMQSTIMLSEKIKRGEIEAKICNSVHDSLWFYIQPHVLEETTAKITEVMETPPAKRFVIPFSVEAKQLNKES